MAKNEYQNKFDRDTYDVIKIRLRKETNKKARFDDFCKDRKTTMSDVLKKFIDEILEKSGY